MLTELMDGLCTFFARAGKERPPMTGSSSSETPWKRKAPPTWPSVEHDVQQRTEWLLRKQCLLSGGNQTEYQTRCR